MRMVPIIAFLLIPVASWLDAYSQSPSARVVIWCSYWSAVLVMFVSCLWWAKKRKTPIAAFITNAAAYVGIACLVLIFIQPSCRRSVEESIDAANELEKEVEEIRQRNAARPNQR